MKTFLLMALLTMGLTAQASQKDITLANPGDFFVLNNVNKPSTMIFVSYIGNKFNHCGISVRSGSPYHNGQDLKKILKIGLSWVADSSLKDESQVVDNQLVVETRLDFQTYGMMYTISTRSGKTVAEELNILSPFVLDAIAEVLPCHK